MILRQNDYLSPKFDFINGRELEGCVANENRLFKQAFGHLKPGGYFEFDGAYSYYYYFDDGTDAKAENLHFLTKKSPYGWG